MARLRARPRRLRRHPRRGDPGRLLIAGFSRRDPFFWLFTITLQFHLGIRISPYSPPREGLFDPPAFLAAFERGAAMTLDLGGPDFDPWAYFHRPLADVRRELSVAPR